MAVNTYADSLVTARCPDLWFEDGNIIIRAENTFFKVYKGILRRQSEVFDDLLTLPQPNDVETVDGCHVVRLEGTSAREVRLFLLCLHDPIAYHNVMASFEDISLLLDMCHKYIATTLEERIVSQLSHFFPCSLEQFLSSEADDKKKAAPFDYTSFECNVRIANAASKIGALRLLPAALFRLCRYKTHNILQAELSPENMRAVLVGRARLSAYAREGTYKYLFDTISPTSNCCHATRSLLANRLPDADGWLDPLQPRMITSQNPPLCQQCTQRTLQCYDEGRARTWAKLPGFFSLPKWSTFIPRDNLSPELELYAPVSAGRRPIPDLYWCGWLVLFIFVCGILWYLDGLLYVVDPSAVAL